MPANFRPDFTRSPTSSMKCLAVEPVPRPTDHAVLNKLEGFLRGENFGVVVRVHGSASLDFLALRGDIYL